jgi:DNA-binding Lrp family transcriptional regulator
MPPENIENLRKNCEEYAKAKKGIDVLRSADGKTHYKDIAQSAGIHPTTASSLLKKAERFGLAKKVKSGFYKKLPGVLGYMPSRKKAKNNSAKTVSDILQKLAKRKAAKRQPIPSSGVSIPVKVEVNLDKMANAYRDLYAVENTLRELIRAVLSPKADWWKNNVPGGIQAVVAGIIQTTPYDAAKRKDELEYAHLGQLKEIIISKKNWSDFLPFLNETNKNSFSAIVDKAIPSRNAIGHCIPLKGKDLKVVDVRFEDILKMLK